MKTANIVLGVSGFAVFFFVLRTQKKHYKTTATSTFPLALTKKTRNHEKWKKK